MSNLVTSLKLTAKAPENRSGSKRKVILPTIHSQVRAVSFREGTICPETGGVMGAMRLMLCWLCQKCVWCSSRGNITKPPKKLYVEFLESLPLFDSVPMEVFGGLLIINSEIEYM